MYNKSTLSFKENFILKSLPTMTDIRKRYENDFRSESYAKNFISSKEYELKWFIEDFYHRLFSQRKIHGKTLIDVGCGPTNRAAIIASRYGCEVYCADISASTRNFVKNWLENGHEAFDLTPQFKHVAQLEGKNDFKYIESRVKKSVKEVMFCDIMADEPLYPRPFEQFDIVASSLCLDCYPDEKDYLKGAQGIASLVRPGGYLVYTGAIRGTYYNVADVRFPSANANSAKAVRALTRAGIKVLEVSDDYFTVKVPRSYDAIGFYAIYAIKE